MPPLVCIVLLNWNQCEETLNCLESLTDVAYSPRTIAVVDNGSADNSVPEIRRRFPSVRVMAQNHNTGCSGGRNVGLELADSLNADYVLFLDNDTVVDPGFLSHLVDAAEEDQRIGIVSSKIVLHSDSSVCWTAGGVVHPNGTVDALYYYQPASDVPGVIYDVDWVPGCVLLARREAYKALGDFDDSYFIYFEDIDWCLRAKECGYRIAVVPHSIVYHKVSQSSGGDYSPRKLYYWSRNRLVFARRQVSGIGRWTTVASLVREDIADAIGDIVLMRQPKHAKGRCTGTLHFFLNRMGSYDV